jgi:hypothetical protein
VAEQRNESSVCPECHLETPIVVGGVEVDACFGDMLGKVMNACCGHGDPARAYVRIKRLHGNSGSPCVDICGGEVVGFGEWTDRHR